MAEDDEGPAIKVRPAQPDGGGLSGGNPFGKPAGNPFAAPEAPESNPFAAPETPASNPFAQPASNPFAQPASNPFAQPAEDAADRVAGAPPPASNPFAAPPAVDETPALDFGVRPSEPAAAPSVEVDDWNKSFNTGEFKIQAESNEGEDRSSVITGDFAAPKPEQLAGSAPTPPRRRAEPNNASADDGGGAKIFKIAVVAVITVGLLAVGGKVIYGKMTKKTPTPVAGLGEPDDFVRRMQADAENAPDCWTSDDGFSFVYKAKSGDRLKVNAIADVPMLFRKGAICVPEF